MKKEFPTIKFIFFTCLIIFLANISASAQTTYYISSSGSDSNDGKSMDNPWKTIRAITPGNTFLMKCGDTFFFKINKIDNPLNKKIVISSYGSGKKPVISLFKNIRSSAWQSYTTSNVYKVDLKMLGNYTGFLDTSDTNVGFIKVNGKIWGNKVSSVDMLASNWDFYSDTQFLYVYSTINPANNSGVIQVATKYNIITLSDNMTVNNLSLTGAGGHAIQGVNSNNVTVSNVDINEIGGSYLSNFGNGKTRYGNGIEFWTNASNCLVTGCNVKNCYDVAFTIQSTKPNSNFSNVIFTNNKASYNEQSFEFWVQGANSNFTNCKFTNNYCTDAGYGWSHDVRPVKSIGVHLLNFFVSNGTNDLTISDNTFLRARNGLTHSEKVPIMSTFKIKHNTTN